MGRTVLENRALDSTKVPSGNRTLIAGRGKSIISCEVQGVVGREEARQRGLDNGGIARRHKGVLPCSAGVLTGDFRR